MKSCISSGLQAQMNRAQYFTAVSSQGALRHVGISEVDYATRFISLGKNACSALNAPNYEPRRTPIFENMYAVGGDNEASPFTLCGKN